MVTACHHVTLHCIPRYSLIAKSFAKISLLLLSDAVRRTGRERVCQRRRTELRDSLRVSRLYASAVPVEEQISWDFF